MNISELSSATSFGTCRRSQMCKNLDTKITFTFALVRMILIRGNKVIVLLSKCAVVLGNISAICSQCSNMVPGKVNYSEVYLGGFKVIVVITVWISLSFVCMAEYFFSPALKFF